MSKKIIIFGAGLSGLTIAHELVEKGFNVEIYEKDSINGGMTRSFRDNNDVPTEHSWRGYGPFYKNLYDILNRIPLPNSNVNIETFSSARLEDTQRVFSLEEVIKHNKENDAWCTYENNVYNITNYISKHPGGSIIKNAIGKDLSEVWTKFGVAWHMDNSSILSKLERYKIGKLSKINENFSDSPNIKTKTVNDNLRTFKMMLLKNKVQNHNNKINIDIVDYPYLIYLFSKIT
jgi:cytochrome b involved in lipid metabolism